MNFKDIAYLKSGNTRQRQAYATLTGHHVLTKLRQYDPILVGTIPLAIDIDSSDLDIICCAADLSYFSADITANFGNTLAFSIRTLITRDAPAVVANFRTDGFEVEIFGQDTPTTTQLAYRHLIVEHKLLQQYGEPFRQQIIRLKKEGYKTEPAFAAVLGLEGDPYMELLRFG